MAANPFTPTFGTVPTILAGRDDILRAMEQAFAQETRDPNLSSIFLGARGSGKTALLSCVEDIARDNGWLVASTIASSGMLQDLFEQTLFATETVLEPKTQHPITSIGVGGLSLSWEVSADMPGNWRTRMTRVLRQLEDTDAGLLFTVDEVRGDIDEMISLASIYQLFVREGRKVALVMAGLPYHVHRLITNDSVSFLRRSRQYDLERISNADVESALRQSIEGAGRTISDGALNVCVEAIEGFPYMLQLVGYRAWIESGSNTTISIQDAKRAVKGALREMEEHIVKATIRELSDGDIKFLRAMLDDTHESRLSNIAQRMGVTSSYATKYKTRLLAQGVISEVARGKTAFAIPGVREYLESHPDLG